MSEIYYDYYNSPIGKLLIAVENNVLIFINFEKEQVIDLPDHFQQAHIAHPESWSIFCKTREILDRYFSGEPVEFSHLNFIQPKGTAFQRSVWKALTQIPYGKTTSYGEIAKQLGNPNAVRAVGGAVGRNPVSILIPCHRVLGKDQSLTGFGGGLPTKRYLLNLENIAYKDKGTEFVKPKFTKWRG